MVLYGEPSYTSKANRIKHHKKKLTFLLGNKFQFLIIYSKKITVTYICVPTQKQSYKLWKLRIDLKNTFLFTLYKYKQAIYTFNALWTRVLEVTLAFKLASMFYLTSCQHLSKRDWFRWGRETTYYAWRAASLSYNGNDVTVRHCGRSLETYSTENQLQDYVDLNKK